MYYIHQLLISATLHSESFITDAEYGLESTGPDVINHITKAVNGNNGKNSFLFRFHVGETGDSNVGQL